MSKYECNVQENGVENNVVVCVCGPATNRVCLLNVMVCVCDPATNRVCPFNPGITREPR